MTIRFMWKAGGSVTGNCPALYETEGGYYVQGSRVTDARTRAELATTGAAHDCPLGDTEDFVFVPADVLDHL